LTSIVDLVFEQSLVNDSSANTPCIYAVIVDLQKAGKQGWDDSMKQFGIQPHLHNYIGGKICRVELCVILLYPNLHLFDLLSLHVDTFLVLYSCVLLTDIMIGLASYCWTFRDCIW